MFWRFSYSSSQIQTLLEKEDVTLQEIINEDEVLQECKSNNEKLINFLTENKNMETLLAHIIAPNDTNIDENTCFKNSTISCELLTCDIPAMNDIFFQNTEFIDKLYMFLYNQPPLNPLLASYFAKIIGSLILRKTDQFLDYIQSKEDFSELFLKHINTSAIMDILLRFLTTIENQEMKKRVLDWLNNIKIIEKIIELFSHEYSSEIHSNAAQILCDIIRISREQIVKVNANENDLYFTPEFNIDSNSDDKYDASADEEVKEKSTSESENNSNNSSKTNEVVDLNKSNSVFESNPLLSAIENPENVNRLFDLIFDSVGKKNCSLKDGVDVLLTLIDENTFFNHFQDASNKISSMDIKSIKGVESVIKNSIKRISFMQKFLKEFKPRVGFGTERLCVVKLLSKLIILNSSELHTEMIRLGTMNLLIDFMFEFNKNNFLHTLITNIVRFLFHSIPPTSLTGEIPQENFYLLNHVLNDCKLIQKLVENWTKYFNQLAEDKKKSRACYIGHLVVISNLVWNCDKTDEKQCSVLKEILEKDTALADEWKNLNETKIAAINNKFTKDLVRNPYNAINNDSNSENEMFELQNNEKINKNDLFSKLQSVSFQMDSNDETENLFEQICQQRDNMCFNNNTEQNNSNLDDDAWISKEIKFSETFNSFSSSKAKENVMDISEDDYYLDGKKSASDEPKKEALTKTLFTQKNNSSLTSSSSSSSSDEESEGNRKKATIFKIDEPMESSNMEEKSKETDLFKIVKESEFDLFSQVNKVNTKQNTQSFFAENDSPLSNVEWTDFSNFATKPSSVNKTGNDILPLNDPWSSNEQEKKEEKTKPVVEISGENNDNWANFD